MEHPGREPTHLRRRSWRRAVRALIVTLWRGRGRLWVTYWVFGVGGNMSFVALLVAIAAAGPEAVRTLWAVYLLSLAWFTWIFGGIWRSAGHYEGPRIWSALARLGVCIGVVRMAAEALLLGLMARAPDALSSLDPVW